MLTTRKTRQSLIALLGERIAAALVHGGRPDGEPTGKERLDPETIVARLGGTLEFVPGTAYPLIERVEDGFRLVLRDADERERVWNVAHALGHLFVHMGYIVSPERWESATTYIDAVQHRWEHSECELEANLFASGFLAPQDAFLDSAVRHLSQAGTYDLAGMADELGVPMPFIRRRGLDIGAFTTAY